MRLLKINTLNLSESYYYSQKGQRIFNSMTIDTTHEKLILGGVTDSGDILITKTPFDKISTESFLQDQQDLGLEESNSTEFNLITHQTIFLNSLNSTYTPLADPFVDISANSSVNQTVVYLKNGSDSYEVYKGNACKHISSFIQSCIKNFSYDAS